MIQIPFLGVASMTQPASTCDCDVCKRIAAKPDPEQEATTMPDDSGTPGEHEKPVSLVPQSRTGSVTDGASVTNDARGVADTNQDSSVIPEPVSVESANIPEVPPVQGGNQATPPATAEPENANGTIPQGAPGESAHRMTALLHRPDHARGLGDPVPRGYQVESDHSEYEEILRLACMK
jgi:hypothetical protein